MDDNNKSVSLEGEEALKIWRQGSWVWNKWVKENPIAYVDFSEVDFSRYRPDEKSDIDFSGYHFPKGTVTFRSAEFGDGNVSFDDANFGNGDVSFRNATFGDGDVSFDAVTFGDGNVSFYQANFGNGNVSFHDTSFGKGNVSFYKAKFGNGDVNFNSTKFGDGEVSFQSASFGNGSVSFHSANFGDGNVLLSDVVFGDGDVAFYNATFGDGYVSFIRTTFDKGSVIFDNAHFKGHISLAGLNNAGRIKLFTLKHAIFEKSLDLSQNNFNCVIDLTNTKMANQVSLDGLKCLVTKATTDNRDIPRLRRLKEIAESNKAHQQALAFHADEMRAMRWHELGRAALTLDWLYDKMSNYGQSILRPAILLVVASVCFTLLYVLASGNLNFNSDFSLTTIVNILELTAASMLPFLPAAKPIIMSSLNALYQTSEAGIIPVWYNLASLIQSFVAFVLLFLIGLGIRNRFRI